MLRLALLACLCALPARATTVCVQNAESALALYLDGYREDIALLYQRRDLNPRVADPLIFEGLRPDGFDRAARMLTGLQGQSVLALYHLDADAICVFAWVSAPLSEATDTLFGLPLAPVRFIYARQAADRPKVLDAARHAVDAVVGAGASRGILRAPQPALTNSRAAAPLEAPQAVAAPVPDAAATLEAATAPLRFAPLTEALLATRALAIHLPADLALLPLLALPLGGDAPLVETHAVTMVERLTSIVAVDGTSTLPNVALPDAADPKRQVAFGVPLLLWSPVTPETGLVVADPAIAPEGYAGLTFPPLPGARVEAGAVATLLGARLVEGAGATGATVLAAVETAELFHYAGHGVASSVSPLDKSYLALADGGLTARKIQTLRLKKAPLVVLSACETGRGQAAGAGVIGLARAFQRAGASGTVISHWPVSDATAGPLMIDFYRELALAPPAEALRRAALAARARHPSPADWAAFGYFGTPFVGMAPP